MGDKVKPHKWEDNKCIKCGIERRAAPFAHLKMMLYDYKFNGKWITDRPECINNLKQQ